MHHSRLCAILIDCNTADVDAAAEFWAQARGRRVDPRHAGSRGNYRMLETPPDEPLVQIQRVSHESRVHLDIESDDISAEVTRLEKLGAAVVEMGAGTTTIATYSGGCFVHEFLRGDTNAGYFFVHTSRNKCGRKNDSRTREEWPLGRTG